MRPYYVQLVFNIRHPLLKQATVRQALSYAVDRQAIIDLALNRQGTIADGPIWPYHWAYSTAPKVYTHNTEAATLRLDAAGLRLPKTAKAGQMPARFRLKCLTLAKDPRYEKIALILQKQFYEIGVDMEIEALPARDLISRLRSGNFDLVLMERTSGRSLAWTYLSFHSSQNPGRLHRGRQSPRSPSANDGGFRCSHGGQRPAADLPRRSPRYIHFLAEGRQGGQLEVRGPRRGR